MSSPSLVPQVSAPPSKKKSSGGGGDDPLRKTKKKKGHKAAKTVHTPIINLPSNLTSKPGRPNEEGPSSIPGFNLAGRPDSLLKTDQGLKRHEVKSVGPYHTSNINEESYLHFLVASNKNEWIRFNSESLTLALYGVYNNPNVNAAAEAGTEARSPTHAMRALSQQPDFFVDPSVMGSGFFTRCDVSINNVPCTTNSGVGELFQQYVRCCRVFNDKPGPHFATTGDVAFGATRAANKAAITKGAQPFDYVTWNSTSGVRVPVYLDGMFPFDFKNRTLESVDGKKEPNLFFPPDTTIEFKFHLHRDKIYSIFHDNVTMANYFTNTAINRAGGDPKLTFVDAILQYESVELKAAEHVKAMSQYDAGGFGVYEYDIPRGQHQGLTSNQSYTENNFQIMPFARLVYLLFLPDHATMIMENRRRPLSGLTRFPENSTSIKLSFAGEESLITSKFERFGILGEDHQISKKIYYEYLKSNKMIGDRFDELFPRETGVRSLIQGFVVDLKPYYSDKTEILSVKCEFSGGELSPERTQIACITVHPNGKAVCKSGGTPFNWIWNFTQPV